MRPNSSFEGSPEINSRNSYLPHDEVNRHTRDFQASASTSNLQQTSNHESRTPFISRAASYNSALGYSGNGAKDSNETRKNTAQIESHNNSGFKSDHNIQGTAKTTSTGNIIACDFKKGIEYLRFFIHNFCCIFHQCVMMI